MAGITHVPHLFSMKHIFLEQLPCLYRKKEKKKKFELEQSSWRHKIR